MSELSEYLKLQQHQTCIFAGCDDKYAFCLYVSLWSLLKHSPKLAQEADIFVAGFKLSAENKKALESLPGVHVINYTYPSSLPQTSAIMNFTEASFARYDCFGLLKYYEKVLYLDSDVLVQKEIRPIFDQLSDGIGLVQDPTFTTVRGNFYKEIPQFNMNATGYNSGFIVLNNKGSWANKALEIRSWLYKQTLVYAENLFLPDQGMINLAIEQFNMYPLTISEDYNCPASSPAKELRNAYIIHSTGPRKFWCYYYFKEWYEGYSRWLAAGGHPVSIHRGSAFWRWTLRKLHLDNKVFFQLCPDFFTKPLKFVRFFVKKIFKVRF